MLGSASQPYSRVGLEALQQSLKLHGELVQPVIWDDPATHSFRLKQIHRTEKRQL